MSDLQEKVAGKMRRIISDLPGMYHDGVWDADASSIWVEIPGSVLRANPADEMPDNTLFEQLADAAITAVIETLAAEAEAGVVHAFRDPNDGRRSTRRNIGPAMADWLRGHLPTTM